LKIPFSKITTSPKEFSFKKGEIELRCTLVKEDRESVLLSGVISGDVNLDCDRCAKSFKEPIEWELKLLLSNVALKDIKDLDIIEFIKSDIDLDFILDSEVNSYKLLYHYCKDCQNGDGEFCMEF
jgi:uncharacterized metal-binding protein YceD (DUF177 family)